MMMSAVLDRPQSAFEAKPVASERVAKLLGSYKKLLVSQQEFKAMEKEQEHQQ